MKLVAPVRKHCVYHHRFGDQLFYIGSGTLSRAVNTEHRARGPHWRRFIADYKVEHIEIEIVQWFDTRKEARQFERSQILELKPVGNNETHELKWWERDRKTPNHIIQDVDFRAKLKAIRGH